MKNIIVLLFLIFNFTAVLAQEIKGWRIKAGTNIATQKWENQYPDFVDDSYKSGQFYELGREVKIKHFLSVGSSLAYQEMGFSSDVKLEYLDPGVYENYINHFRYLTLQAALKLQLPNGKYKPYLIAGYQGGVLLSWNLDVWSEFFLFQRVRHYDDGPALGFGFEMNTGKGFIPFIEFSHYRSIRNVLKYKNTEIWGPDGARLKPTDVRNRVYTIGGGIKF